jgi:hypothetical protein
MSKGGLRKADRQRLVNRIVDHLKDFPRQVAALESAMAEFGEDFDLARFKEAYNAVNDPQTYNRAQSLERAIGRVQNLMTDLTVDGVRLGGLSIGALTVSKTANDFIAPYRAWIEPYLD